MRLIAGDMKHRQPISNADRPVRGWWIGFGVFLCALAAALPVGAWGQQEYGTVRGQVTDRAEGESLPGANVRLVPSEGEPLGTMTDADGRYVIPRVPPGLYVVEASYIGYRPYRLGDVSIAAGREATLDIALVAEVLDLDEMVVTPGRFSMFGDSPSAPQTLTRRQFEAMAFVGQDIYRAVTRLPGVSASDFSSRFTVRGGDYDQILVTLDGMELYEPFHLKDLGGGVLSIVDAGTIQGVDLMTGGFPADYGDRQSAVLEMTTRAPREGALTQGEVGITQYTLRSEGRKGRLSWLSSARINQVGAVYGLFSPDEEDFSPGFYDAFAKLTWEANDRHQFSAHGLLSSDRLKTQSETTRDTYESRYANGYGWITWHATPSSDVHVRTIAHLSQVYHRRQGIALDNADNVVHLVDDWRNTHNFGVKSDASFRAGNAHRPRIGFEVKGGRTQYDFFKRVRQGSTYGVTNYRDTPDGSEIGVYASDKWHLGGPLTADVGVRYDRQSYTGDSRVSPRAGLAVTLGDATTVRGAWGQYHQSQALQELDVEDGQPLFRRSQLATHFIAGVEHRFGRSLLLRVEGYHKELDHIRDRFENLDDESDFLPEIESDRIHLYPETGKAQGIEVYLRRDTGRLNWWMNYALSIVEETHSAADGQAEIQGETVPRRFDQQHAFSVDLIFRPRDNWHLGAAWEIRSGWPYTPRFIETVTLSNGTQVRSLVPGDFLSGSYPVYHRLDFKISHWYDYANVQLRAAFGVTNVYNRLNVRRYTYSGNAFGTGGNGPVPASGFSRAKEGWLPALPFIDFSLGF